MLHDRPACWPTRRAGSAKSQRRGDRAELVMVRPSMSAALAVVLALAVFRQSEAAEIAVTLDDLPYAVSSRVTPGEGRIIVESINRTLKQYGVKAMGFAVGERITPESRAALMAFVEAGHTIGNHSWSHPDYNTLTPDEFMAETARTDRAISPWVTEGRFYRFPFLHQGETPENREASAKVLADLGYRNVPVSIDDDDYQFNSDYMDALESGDPKAAQDVVVKYLEHMKERTAYFQTLAKEKFGRDVKHIVLLHMNKINADHLGALLAWYKSEGWTFITAQEALTDPVYSMEDRYAGAKGLSQIERVTWPR